MADRDHPTKPFPAVAIPRRFFVANVLGVCVGVSVGLAIYIGQNSDYGLVIVFWALVGSPLFLRRQLRNGRRLHDPTERRDQLTGRTLTPPAVVEGVVTGKRAAQWTGAADVPTFLGRINATNPLARLELGDSALTLRLRPAFLIRWQFACEPLVLSPSEVEGVFPARGRLRAPAIGIRPLHGPPSYFLTAPGPVRWYFGAWSADRASILSAMSEAGFPVEWEERSCSRA
jgi:hypothetical protein